MTGVALIDPSAVSLDRHGRLRGQLRGPDGAWLQARLVERGLAVVAPAADVPPEVLDHLLRLERSARETMSKAAGPTEGSARIRPSGSTRRRAASSWCAGAVRSVSRRYEFTYLDFGTDWRRDFTVRDQTRSLQAFARDGLDVAALQGERILVRGWLFSHAGPMIDSCMRGRSRWRNEADGGGGGRGGAGARPVGCSRYAILRPASSNAPSLSPEEEVELGRQEHPKALRQFGGAYPDQALPAYIEPGVGERVKRRLELGTRSSPSPCSTARWSMPSRCRAATSTSPAAWWRWPTTRLSSPASWATRSGTSPRRHSAQRYDQAQIGQVGALAAQLGGMLLGGYLGGAQGSPASAASISVRPARWARRRG